MKILTKYINLLIEKIAYKQLLEKDIEYDLVVAGRDSKILDLNEEIKTLKEKINDLNESKEAKIENDKWPRGTITYNGRYIPNRTEKVPIDVRQFIWNRDKILDKVVKISGAYNEEDNDEKVYKLFDFVKRNIRYISDKTSVGYTEFWQFANETMLLKTGDCEDGAILLASLLRCAGIKPYRVKVSAGAVQDPNDKDKEIG